MFQIIILQKADQKVPLSSVNLYPEVYKSAYLAVNTRIMKIVTKTMKTVQQPLFLALISSFAQSMHLPDMSSVLKHIKEWHKILLDFTECSAQYYLEQLELFL